MSKSIVKKRINEDKKSTDLNTSEFWEELKYLIPKGKSITGEQLFTRFGRKGTGVHTVALEDRGYIHTNFKGEISIVESERIYGF